MSQRKDEGVLATTGEKWVSFSVFIYDMNVESLHLLVDYGDGVQSMKIDDEFADGHSSNTGEDVFSKQLAHFETGTVGIYSPIVVDKNTLISLQRDEILIVKWPSPGMRNKYYRNMMPELPISLCKKCNHFFHEEDFEFEVLKLGKCPVCRSKENEIM